MPSPEFRFSPRPNNAGLIQWRSWGEDAFEEAAATGKPVLLSISAVWCHWCHVMDETSYSDLDNIQRINEGFIPIRVDNDRRPDINQRYNQGGWPTTAFLTAEGEILAGTTYLPADRLQSVLQQVQDYYTGNREGVAEKVRQVRERRAAMTGREGSRVGPGDALPAEVVEVIRQAYDEIYGGLGNEPKFPHPEALNLLLDQYAVTGDLSLLHMVTNTLDQMRSRGIWDKVEGGFFRYSTTKDWEIPHFEKMLEGEAGLLGNYLYAHRLTGEHTYLDTARALMAYVDRTLFNAENGYFYGSQDADEHYFSLDAPERAKLMAPFVDPVLYVSWNAEMASQYIAAAWTAGDAQPLAQGLRVLNFLWACCHDGAAGMYHVWDGAPAVAGLLVDQTTVATALLDAYDATGDLLWLQRAIELATVLQRDYHDGTGGGFYDTRAGHDQLGNLQFRTKNIEENAEAAGVFLRLAAIAASDAYRELAESVFRAFATEYQHYGYFASGFARAFIRSKRPPLEAHLVGARGDEAARSLAWAVLRLPEPSKTVTVIDPAEDTGVLDELGYPPSPAPAVYLCHNGACSAPVTDAAGVARMAQSLNAPFRTL